MHDDESISKDTMKAFNQILEQQAYEECIPIKGTFELTARCNFNCNMCYVHLNEKQIREIGRELTNKEWLAIARQARDAGLLNLTLTGGEVFARPGFRELYEALAQMGFLIQIFSNGYLIDDGVMEWLKETPPYCIRFTLYGMSNDTYEKVCGIKQGYDRVMKAIDLIQEAKIPIYLVGMIVKENEHDLQQMYTYAASKGILFDHSIAVVKPVRGATADAIKHRIDKADFSSGEVASVKRVERLYRKVDNLLERCSYYRRGFSVTWDGIMSLCNFMKEPGVLLTEESFLSAWDTLQKKLGEIKTPRECTDCKYEGFCKRCPGLLAAECGSCEEITPEFCNAAKRLYEAMSITCVQES